MPFKAHPVFKTPKREAKIFRYMSFEKFMALIETSSLFFSSLHTLAELDPFEGEYSDANKAIDAITWNDLPPQLVERYETRERYELLKQARIFAREDGRKQKKITFANCWHIQDYESAAMWKLYTHDQKGIAIVSTVGRLIDSLASYTDFNVMIGEITYLNFDVDAISEGNMFSPFMHKRKYFDYEKEMRAIIWTAEDGKYPITVDTNPFSTSPGIRVPVNLERLIDYVILSPTTESWEDALMKSVIKRYGINRPTTISRLAVNPTP